MLTEGNKGGGNKGDAIGSVSTLDFVTEGHDVVEGNKGDAIHFL
jgi:hypothetical protein